MRGLWAVLLLSALACAGCKEKKGEGGAASVLFVSHLSVKERGAAQHRLPGFGEKEVEALVQKRIHAAPATRLDTTKKGYRLRVEYGLGPRRGEDDLAALVVVRLDPGPEGGIPLESSLIAPLKEKGAAMRAHLERTLGAALTEVFWQAGMLRSRPKAVLSALRGEKNTDRLEKLIPIVAERGIKEAVPLLIRLLSHEKLSVVDRSIGALATLKDARAVKPLTKLAKLRDSRRLAQVIDVVASIGGDEASSFLDFLAGGHADPAIRNLAREARERMKRNPPPAP